MMKTYELYGLDAHGVRCAFRPIISRSVVDVMGQARALLETEGHAGVEVSLLGQPLFTIRSDDPPGGEGL